MRREFRDVPLPRWHDNTPLIEGTDERLALELPGVAVCLDDPDDDPAFPPEAKVQPLGTVTGATPAGDHVLATIEIDLDSLGADRIAQMLDLGEMRFGLWGVAEIDPVTHGVSGLRPTSVRISNTRPLR